MYKPDSSTSITKAWNFASYGELINFAINREAASAYVQESRSFSYGSSWSGTESFEDAVKLAQNGWPEGSQKVQNLTNILVNKVSDMIEQPVIQYDVTGNDFDIALYLNNVPEYWTTFHTDEAGMTNRVVKILFNIATSAGIIGETMKAKGAAIAALVIILEQIGIRVELELGQAVTCKGKRWEIKAVVKEAAQPLDIDRLTFALAHPSSLRRLIFSVEEADQDFCNTCNTGYGMPAEILNVGEKTLYVGSSMLGAPQWADKDSTVKWIVEKLKEQGVNVLG
jgi:hypothetical protein